MANNEHDQSPASNEVKHESGMPKVLSTVLGLVALLAVAFAGQIGKQIAKDAFGVGKPRMDRGLDAEPETPVTSSPVSGTFSESKRIGTGVRGEIHAAGIKFVAYPPNGFVRLRDESRDVWNEVKRFVPPRAELAAVFVTTDDMAQILLNERPELAEYIAITTISDANKLDATATRTVFAALRKQFQSQIPIDFAEAARQINERLADDDANRTVGGSAVVDYFDFGQDTFGLVMLVNQTIESETLIKTNCSAITLVQNKIVQVSTTRHYQNRDDVIALKGVVTTLVSNFE